MKCGKCGRVMGPKAARCMFCGGEPVAEAVADLEIPCPSCSKRMQKVDRDGLVLDECPGCGGTWFDSGEMETLLERERQAEPAAAKKVARFEIDQTAPVYRRCPRCSQSMARLNFQRISGVIVDSCRNHGVFLDVGEFEQIAVFLDSGGEAAAARAQSDEDARLASVRASAKRIALQLGGAFHSDRYGQWSDLEYPDDDY